MTLLLGNSNSTLLSPVWFVKYILLSTTPRGLMRLPIVFLLTAMLNCVCAAETPATTSTISNEATVTEEPPAVTPKENPLTEQLLEREYQRMPQLALQAMAQVMAGTLGDDLAQRFATDLQAGAWKSVRKTLDTLPAEGAGKVYDHVLQQLLDNGGQLLPGEVIDLAEVAPGELSDHRLNLLGMILRNSIDLVSTTGSLVARLEAGTAQFGGKDPVHRGRAAALLLAANRVIEAGAFLPPLDAALAAGDDITLDLHARFLAANGRKEKQPADLLKAWELSLAILGRNDARPTLIECRSRAATRCLSLLEDVAKETADAWLRTIFINRPELGQAVFAAVAAQASQGGSVYL
jgi:hypothetical protein